MQYQNIPYKTGEIVVLADLHYDTYRRLALGPFDVLALQDIV